MNYQETYDKLYTLVHPIDREGKTEQEVIEVFQEQNGLEVDGQLGQVTARTVERPRFCAMVLPLQAKGTRARWDHTRWNGKAWVGEPANMQLTYHVVSELTGLTRQQTDAAFAEALKYWTDVCAVVFTPIQDAKTANVLIKVDRIDGESSTLAWAELPAGPDTPKTQLDSMYDSGEPWVDSADPPNGRIDAVRVICHEFGHILGLDHGPDGNLLAPYYDRSIRRPQAWDISEVQVRYGQPVPVTPTTPTVPPAGPPQQVRATVYIPGLGQYDGELKSTKI